MTQIVGGESDCVIMTHRIQKSIYDSPSIQNYNFEAKLKGYLR